MLELPDPRKTYHFVIDTLDPRIDEFVAALDDQQRQLLLLLADLRHELLDRIGSSDN